MGKRRGIGVELDVNSDTLNKISEIWECFSEVTGLNKSQIEGIVYEVTCDKKMKYLIAERRTSKKPRLSINDICNAVDKIGDVSKLNAGYCIVHIPETGWTRKKIEPTNDKYVYGLDYGKTNFRVERFNVDDNTIVIQSTLAKNI